MKLSWVSGREHYGATEWNSGLPGEDILYLQGALITRAEGASDEMIAKERALQEKMFAVVKGEEDNAIAERKLHEILEQTGKKK